MYRTILFVALFMMLAGCSSNQSLKEAWKFTSKQYRTYLNTPASVDYDAKGGGADYEVALGEAVLEVDREISTLVRIMENTGRTVDAEWVYSTMRRLPWLSGVALVDSSGELLTHFPDVNIAEFDAQPLFEEDPKQRIAMLRSYVQMGPNGAKVYVANPVFLGPEMRGLVVAHFDPRNLLIHSPNPGSFSIVSVAGTLWAGGSGGVAGEVNWAEEMERNSSGKFGSGSGGYYWVSRYIGNLPIAYVISTSATSLAASAVVTEQPTEQNATSSSEESIFVDEENISEN